ncbi:hypothetical protein B0H10DRAFT_2008034 [Mycena sp. CBHHK59/15]|nr:hypothetical protein B0H10DRAFT_2008034 [Mycena sp. CBHHK59/15]
MSIQRRTLKSSRASEYDEPEDAWEDIENALDYSKTLHPEEEVFEKKMPLKSASRTSPSNSVMSVSTRTPSPRKRRYKTVYVAAPSPRRIPQPPAAVAKPPNARVAIPTDQMVNGGVFIVSYALDVLKTAIQLLRKPLSFLVFLWLFAFILSRISHTIRAAFRPLCYIPGISSSAMCLPDGYATAGNHQSPRWADYPKLVDVQSATFEQLLDESTSGAGLALQIKKAEMATVDLVTLVRVSELRSRDMLADHLRQFVDDARTAGRALQKLNSKVSGAVDGIMAVNDYALHTIEAAHSNAPSVFQSLIPWSSSKPTADLLNLSNLDKLEEQLSVLHELVSREDTSISSVQSELLGELWTKVGGNRRKLRGYEQHLRLLKGLTEYRKRALVHVVSALQTLRQMSEDIENLRERVAAPELTGSRIPVEVHIKSIQSGLERLKDGRLKAKARQNEIVQRVLELDPE